MIVTCKSYSGSAPQWAGQDWHLEKVISELSLKGRIEVNLENMPSKGNSLKGTPVGECDLNSV